MADDIRVTDGFEEVELTEPRKALDQAGADTRVVRRRLDLEMAPSQPRRRQIPTRRHTIVLSDWRTFRISAHGSEPSLASRSGTVRTVRPTGRIPFSTSSHNRGVETGAPSRARGV
jgi:putative intracellular protease/amidase